MTEKSDGAGTVQRVVQILRHVAETGETTVKDVAAALGWVPSTSHRMLDILTGEGLIERDQRHGYRLGPEFYRWAALIHPRQDVRVLARPFMQRTVDTCDETCVLCIYLPHDGAMIFADKIDSSQLLRYQLPLNSPMPVLWGASGRAISAFLSNTDIDRIYATASEAPASREPLPRRDELEAEFAAIRERGYAVTRGQKIAGAVGINAPIFDAGGGVIGSFGVTIPAQRVKPADLAKLGRFIRQQAHDLSRALGARQPANKLKVVSQ